MQRLNKQHHPSILASPGRGKGQFQIKAQGGVRFKTDDDFEHFFNNKDIDNSNIIGGGGSLIGLRSGLNQIDEDENQSPINIPYGGDVNTELFERRLYKNLYDLRKDLNEKFNKKIDEIDHKFSVEIAKLTNIIDTELGLEEENDIMEDDESDSSVNSSKQKINQVKTLSIKE